MGEDSQYADDALVNHFLKIREMVKKKRPATAELIAWLRMLESEQFLNQKKSLENLSDEQKKLLRFSYSVLAKDKDDLKILEQAFM